METGKWRSGVRASVMALMVAGMAGGAQAQGGPGYGPGGGYGPGMGMMGGGYGPGAGMMGGGYGPGAGMMGGGYGRGMMGGGYGPGMMAGGVGPGAGGGLSALDLTPEQQDKVFAIQEESRRKNWEAMGKLRTEMFQLRRMFASSEKLDADAVAEQQKKVDELRRQMLRSRVESHNQLQQVLTPEQRKQIRGFGPAWLEGLE